ncbi:DUF3472 domain-containing protein [Haloferula sargassicola]|uniref:DUF5077 domain-containing protein n=1 Tax=Haloferula sargassicola TaxID=490096 RepID=A0ABP9UQ16_9BACT
MKVFTCLLAILPAVPAMAGDLHLADRQCRSVHLAYDAPPAAWATIEVTPTRSAPGTYFCALGFSRGYLGMQELADGKKVILFSVWDSPDPDNKTDRPEDTAESRRAGVVRVGEGVREKRFGGEGTGSQSFFDYGWSLEKPVRFAVHAAADGGLTTFTGYFYDASRRKWQLMTSVRTATRGTLTGLYSFIEDFRRNHESARQIRRASFTDGWVREAGGSWQPMIEARFTADATPAATIDAGPAENGFFLQTGGATANEHVPLGQPLHRPQPPRAAPAMAMPADPGPVR